MTTKISNVFTINGIIDTKQPVLQNMQTIANASGCWITFDINSGKWSVVVNQASPAVRTFNDSNIIGSINLRGTGVYELYNRVELNYPNKDILDQKDVITLTIPPEQRFDNEIENTLNFSLDCINNPVQAELLATRELKQSRIDKIIEFRTDYTAMGLAAGDIINISNSAYGYTLKPFRIVTMSEDDAEDGTIIFSITAIEYDASIYGVGGLIRTNSSPKNDIVSQCSNPAVQDSNARANLPMDIGRTAAATGLFLALNSLTNRWELNQGGPLVSLPGGNLILITWTFTTGLDLDIRCRVYSPNIGQSVVTDYLGYTGEGTSLVSWGPSGGSTSSVIPSYLVWGGDNTGTGSEQVAVDIGLLRSNFPSQRYFIIECRGNWYSGGGQVGTSPVKLQATFYQNATGYSDSGFTFSVSGSTAQRQLAGLDVYVDSFTLVGLGDLMGYLVYDSQQQSAQFVNDLSAVGIF
jgi:hypothetical protein